MPSSSTSSTAVDSSSDRSSRAQAEARAAVLASLQSAGSGYDAQMQQRARDIHDNASAISRQEADMRKHTKALGKESDKWQKEINRATSGLKDFGDLQNFAEMMERDLLVVEETMRMVEGGHGLDSASRG